MKSALRSLSWRPFGWGLLVIVWIVSFFYTTSSLSGEVLCLFRRLTGWSCPGCGLTRAFCAMSSGDLIGAFGFHLAGPFLYVAMVGTIVLGPIRMVGGALRSVRIPQRVMRIFWWFFTALYIGQAGRAVASWDCWDDFPSGLL